MLIPIVRPREHRPALVPDDLLGVEEANPHKAIEHFACEDGCVPDVGDLDTRYQLKSFRPVGARFSGDGFRVALRALLHVAGLVLATTVQPGAIPPLRIELDPVGRVSDHQVRLSQESCQCLGVSGVTTQNAMLAPTIAAEPQVARGGTLGSQEPVGWF